MAGKLWTVEETQFMLDNYEDNGAQFCSEELGRTIDSIKHKAKKLKLRSSKANSNHQWTTEDDLIIKDNYRKNGAVFCMSLLKNRTRNAIVLRAGVLNISMEEQYNKWTHTKYEQELFNKEIDYYPIEQYINSGTPINHECLNEHIWKVTPSHVLGGTNCPYCVDTYGFKPNKPAILYYIKIIKAQQVYYKIGITNRTIEERFNKDKKLCTIIPLLIERYDKGSLALAKEKSILNKYSTKRITVPKLLLSQGNTELFEEDILGLDIEKAQ